MFNGKEKARIAELEAALKDTQLQADARLRRALQEHLRLNNQLQDATKQAEAWRELAALTEWHIGGTTVIGGKGYIIKVGFTDDPQRDFRVPVREGVAF